MVSLVDLADLEDFYLLILSTNFRSRQSVHSVLLRKVFSIADHSVDIIKYHVLTHVRKDIGF